MPYIGLRSDLFGITSLLDYRKEAARPLCELTHLMLRGESTLTESERELIAAYVSYLNECSFCNRAHSAAACMLPGGNQEQLEKVRMDISLSDLSEKMKALLRLAAKVQKGGNYVAQEDIDTAKEQGATERELHDTVLIAALFCLYNRYVDGLSTMTPTDPVFYEALAKRITTRGYLMPEDGYHPLKF